MICAEDCAGEQSFAFLIGEWYDGNYTDYTEGVLSGSCASRLSASKEIIIV
jgi:hypothetical protein